MIAPLLTRPQRTALALLGAAGVAALAYGLAAEPVRTWSAYLPTAFLFLSIALGAVVFLAIQHVANAGWSAVLKRVPEGLSSYLPVGALALLAVLAGAPTLYPWAHAEAAHDPLLQAKAPWLNLPFFAGRMAFILSIWMLFAWRLRRRSRLQDADGSLAHTRRSRALSAGFLLVFAYTFSIAAFDWLMSVEPHWYSTIFAFYHLAGVLVAGVAGITVVTILLRRRGLLPAVTHHHLHDLGKLLFAFATFWAYLWLCQFLLIWYANLPEETVHFSRRLAGGWPFLFWLNVALGFVLPFFALLARKAKRVETHLLWVCLSLLGGRWLDLYLAVAPAGMPEHEGVGLIEAGVVLGFTGLFAAVVARGLRAAPLLARNDPYFEEALHLQQ